MARVWSSAVAAPVVGLLGAALLVAQPAQAQSLPGDCGGGPVSSEVSDPGPFRIGETEVVELDSAVDGAKIQIGYVRPDVPDSYRSPVIVQASPYFLADLRDVDLLTCNPFLTENFVEHGYTVAFVPTRGAGGTDSCADLMGLKERSDLDQAVTWLGSRPWSTGGVGMIGISYDGSTPWGVASMGNPHLRTIVPVSGVHNLFDLIYYRGRNDWRWWFFVPGYYHHYGFLLANPAFGRDPDRWAGSLLCDTAADGLLAQAESYRTNAYDSLGYWAERNMDPDILDRYRGSVFLVQGLQDWNVDPGHQYPFINRLERRGVAVKHMIGQWAHAFPDGDVGGRTDFADILLSWWNRRLAGDRSVRTGPRVEVQDSDLRWRTERSWPPRRATERTLYLAADDTLSEDPSERTTTQTLGPGSRNRYFFLNDNQQVYNDLPIDRFCAACATFAYSVRKTDLRLTGIPELDLTLVPSGPAGHVAAFVFRVDRDDGWHLIGWGASDLRFPQGGYEAQPVEPGEPITMNLPLQPLDAVIHEGETLQIILDQGHADHMPAAPSYPVELRYGAEFGSFTFDGVAAKPRAFFDPARR
jgi:predicted acyl esterase